MLTLDDALAALAGRALSITDAERSPLVASPGLYAVSGDAAVWFELGLGDPPDHRPLYVGKCEGSFESRDLEDHFGNGRTGRSTLRRSFAALLAAELDLVPVPRGRNPLDRTTRATMFGLTPAADARLTAWMRERLVLTLWPCRDIPAVRSLERDVIATLKPPLCIDGKWKPNHWHADPIEPARRAMTAIVRSLPVS